MIGYKQYLAESVEESKEHISTTDRKLNIFQLHIGDIFYTKKNRPIIIHRENGPAIISLKYEYALWIKNNVRQMLVRGKNYIGIFKNPNEAEVRKINSKDRTNLIEQDVRLLPIIGATNVSSEIQQKQIIFTNPEYISLIKNPTIQVQEDIIRRRPDLINKINNLDPELKNRYSSELNLAGIDI